MQTVRGAGKPLDAHAYIVANNADAHTHGPRWREFETMEWLNQLARFLGSRFTAHVCGLWFVAYAVGLTACHTLDAEGEASSFAGALPLRLAEGHNSPIPPSGEYIRDVVDETGSVVDEMMLINLDDECRYTDEWWCASRVLDPTCRLVHGLMSRWTSRTNRQQEIWGRRQRVKP